MKIIIDQNVIELETIVNIRKPKAIPNGVDHNFHRGEFYIDILGPHTITIERKSHVSGYACFPNEKDRENLQWIYDRLMELWEPEQSKFLNLSKNS